MKVRQRQKGKPAAVVFEEIEPFFLDLLRRLPASVDTTNDPAARARLFGDPIAPGQDGDGFNEDWRQFVEPELRDLFRSARQTVEEDLGSLPPPADDSSPDGGVNVFDPAAFAPPKHALEIPTRHQEAWLSVLNQARLVIAARRGFGEKEMDEDLPFPPFGERDLDLFRIHFYDFLQQVILREMGFE